MQNTETKSNCRLQPELPVCRVLDHILGRLRRAKPLEERTAEVNDWVEHAPVIELELLDPIGPT